MKISDNKKTILVIFLISILCSSGGYYYTYARYQSAGSVESDTKTARWNVKVNNVDITPNIVTNFLSNIVGQYNPYVKEGYIAPGMRGTTDLVIDPTGSEVSMNYYIMVNRSTIDNSNFIIESVSVGGSCSDGISEETECENLGLTWTANNLSLTSMGSCSRPEYVTEVSCTNAFEIWTPNQYATAYMGTINLPAGGVMTSNEIINATVNLVWQDLNTSETNNADVLTAQEVNGNPRIITIDVVVEQIIN